MRSASFLLGAATLLRAAVAQSIITLNISLVSSEEIASDKAVFYYPSSNASDVLLIGNDGSATGGFGVFKVPQNSSSVLPPPSVHSTGRSKLVNLVYGIADKDWIVTLSQSDSMLRFFNAETEEELDLGDYKTKVWGDYSAMCGWRSATTGAQYLYIFGKKQVRIYLVRGNDDSVEISEVQTAVTPIEAEGCTVSQVSNTVFFGGDDGNVYAFPTLDSADAPRVRTVLTGDEEISGLATYYGVNSDFLVIIYAETISIFNSIFEPVATIDINGAEDYELSDAGLYQATIGSRFANGAFAFAIESDDITGYAIASLDPLVAQLGGANTDYSPRQFISTNASFPECTSLDNCNNTGFCDNSSETAVCQCFTGFGGDRCSELTCTNDCNARGSCSGPNICTCEDGWSGPFCSFQVVYPKYETEENGEDGDDPAIWISPSAANLSRVITTTKSEVGAGFAVFDLEGKKIQQFPAGEPNNVDVIYGFSLRNETVDLVYSACRADNTLCLAEITSNGTLVDVPGGVQPTPEDYEVYGSCTYHSPRTDKFYVFVNAKDATYLQYELSSTLINGTDTLSTTLIRSFRGGSGGQVEGCVVDNDNGWLILGEEPYGLWRYSAEPPTDLEEGEEDKSAVGYLIDSIDGNLFADVEGVTLINGNSSTAGLILVSCQGMSAYNIYRRAPPHAFLGQFTIATSQDGKIDRVTNTDGIAAVGNSLNGVFSKGLVVVHDDVNESPDGSVSEEAAFKFVSLADLLSEELLREIDTEWDPRSKA